MGEHNNFCNENPDIFYKNSIILAKWNLYFNFFNIIWRPFITIGQCYLDFFGGRPARMFVAFKRCSAILETVNIFYLCKNHSFITNICLNLPFTVLVCVYSSCVLQSFWQNWLQILWSNCSFWQQLKYNKHYSHRLFSLLLHSECTSSRKKSIILD